jgi:hypothetical protein
MTWKEVIEAETWEQLMNAVVKIENTDISMLAYSWEAPSYDDEDSMEIRYNFHNISISIEHGCVESFIRRELDPELQICFIQGDDKKKSLKETINKTIEFLKERIGHEKLERADDLNRGVTR